MTAEEALGMAPDQLVEVRLQNRWVRARVVKLKLMTLPPGVMVTVRRERPSPGGFQPTYRKYPGDLRPLADVPTANVYADFLEEHGESKAAELLRRHFPLDDGRKA